MLLYKVGFTEDTSVGNMVKKDATKRQGSIAPYTLIRTINFIIVMGFPGLFQRKGLTYGNINILWNKDPVDLCVCLPSILYFTC